MAWDEIKFKISADMDFGNAVTQVNAIKEGIGSLKDTMADMPNFSKVLDNSLEKTASVATSLESKLKRLQSKDYRSEQEKSNLERSIGNDISELNTLRSLQTDQGDYSVSLARSWFGGLPTAVQKELDMVVPKVSSIIRSKFGTLKTQSDIAARAIKDPEIQALTSQYLKSKGSQQQMKQLIEDLAPHVIASNRLNPYQIRRYGSIIQKDSVALAKGDIQELFPQSFRSAYANKRYTQRQSNTSDVLSPSSVKELNHLLATNPVMTNVALLSGLARRDSRGVLETKKEISRQDWEAYRDNLYQELMSRASGKGSEKLDPYSKAQKDLDRIASRLTSSSTGRLMSSLHDIEKFEDTGAWTTATGSKKYTKIYNEGKRALNEYVVNKYSPFLTGANGKPIAPKEVTIGESHNTRLLGQGKWRNNDNISDTVALISLAGFDPKNKEQEAQLLDLYRNGRIINGKKYIAQSIHDKGEDQVIRMIEESAFNRVNERENAWAQSRHINGTYWGGFDDAELNRKIREKTVTAKDWGKHLEMLNKAWTPSSDMGLNLANKRIAVVNFNGAGDGATWVSKNMMTDSGQIRFGIGGKGSAFVFDGKNVGEFGVKTGIADKDGRVMMRGPDGKLFDVSGYDMIMPMDFIKNTGAYKDENGNFVSGERASEIATALGRRYGLGLVANYTKEGIDANRIGTQMASFINFSPELRQRQIDLAMARMRELDTEEGQKKYVFGKEDDWLSRKVHENPQLLRTEAAMARVDAYRRSLMNSVIGGEYNDFTEREFGVADMRLVASPLASYLMSHGGIDANGTVKPEVIAKAREYIKADAVARGIAVPEYTDQQISNMIVPDKNTVLDFAHADTENEAVIRSPTGYGNMVYAKNVAAQARPIYEGFGIDTKSGIYVSAEHLPVLQGADYDADEAKVIFDKALYESVKASALKQQFAKPEVPASDIVYTPEQLADKATQQMLFSERKAIMNQHMGAGASGIRIMQLDLDNPSNQQFVREAQRLSSYYDTWTTHDKNAQTMDIGDVNSWNTFKLAKEYTKFSDNIQRFLLDEKQIPEELAQTDIFKASNGQVVNLKTLRELGVDNINLPAAYMPNHMMAVMAQNSFYRSGMVDSTQMDALGEAMSALGYGDAGPARQRLMQTMRSLLPQFGTGERAMLTPAETRAISSMESAAMQELIEDSRHYINPQTGKYEYKNDKGELRQYNTAEMLAEARAANYGIIAARNAVGSFGMTEQRLRSVFGNDFDGHFINATPSQIELLPEDKAALIYEKRVEEHQEEVKEAAIKAEEANRKASRKKNKQLTVEQKQLDAEIENFGKTLGLTKNVNIDEEIKKQQAVVDARLQDHLLNGFVGAENEFVIPEQAIADKQATDRLEGLKKYKELLQKRDYLKSTTPEQRKLDALLLEQKQLEKERDDNLRAVDLRTEYQDILFNANEYGNKLWGFQQGKANRINDAKSYAEQYWSRSYYQANDQYDILNEFQDKVENELERGTIKTETRDELVQGLANARAKIEDNMQKDFLNKSILYAKSVSDEISAEFTKQHDAPTAQKRKIDAFNNEIVNSRSFVDLMQNKLANGNVDPQYQKLYEDAIKDTEQHIQAAEEAKAKLVQEYTSQNEKQAHRVIDNLQVKFGIKRRNSLGVRSETRKEEIQQYRDAFTKQFNEGHFSKSEYDNAMSQLDSIEQRSSKVALVTQDLMGQTVNTVNRVMQRFGRQMFMKALQETKRFVTEFNKSMTTIQMITLKSDDQMSKLGDGLIAKAKELKVSVAEVTQSAETLYRQGLSDQEVNNRLDVISKFSKVSGAKVDAATKLVTVAMNTGLVTDPQMAADIVTALGDNAATNAQQIEKGIEKAGAAAAADGTTFAELASMLTAITSTTQIGGNVAGRTLNTIFGRMNKIGTNELIYDENGNAISGSAVAKLLEAQGISQYENGKKKSSYQTLYEISQKWDTMSDAEQQQLATAIAGTRQYSNFAAIMQGMSEGKVDEYMQLAMGSEGIVDKKYEIYTHSLEASLTGVKNAYDELIHDLTDSGSLTGFLNMITGMISGVDNLTNSFGGLGAMLTTVLPMLVGLSLLRSGISTGSLGLAAAGVGAVILGGGIAALAGTSKTGEERYKEANQFYEEQKETRQSGVDRLKELRDKPIRSTEENSEYVNLINKYANQFGLASTSAGQATYSIESLSSAINNLSSSADQAADSVIREVDEAGKAAWARHITDNRINTIDAIEENIDEAEKQRAGLVDIENPYFNQFLWKYDENLNNGEGGWQLYSNALSALNKRIEFGTSNDALFGFVGSTMHALGADDTSFSRDLKDPLTGLLRAAASTGAMEDFDAGAMSRTSDQWANVLQNGFITQQHLETALNYLNTHSSPTAKHDNIKSAYKQYFTDMLGGQYDEGQIDYLAEQATQTRMATGDKVQAYNSIFGTGTSVEAITESVDKALENYVPTSNVKKNQYGLELLGRNDYYVDQNGNVYNTQEEADRIYKERAKADKQRAIEIMQAHNQSVIDEHEAQKEATIKENEARQAEVDRRNEEKAAEIERLAREDRIAIEEEYSQNLQDEAKRLYYTEDKNSDFLLTQAAEKYYKDQWALLHQNEPGGKWEYMTPEAQQRELAFMQGGGYGITPFSMVSKDVLEKYAEESPTWESLSDDEKAKWLSFATETVKRREAIDTTWEAEKAELLDIPELDEKKLIGGVKATAEQLGNLYDSGEILDEVAQQIEQAQQEANKNAPELVKKTHKFVEALESYNSDKTGWLSKNQAAVYGDTITSALISGQFGSGAEGLSNFMNYVESNPGAELAWQGLTAANQDLQRVMRQATYNKATNTWTAPENIMGQILRASQAGSLTFGASVLTNEQKATIAREAFTGLTQENDRWFISQQAKEFAQDQAYSEYLNGIEEAKKPRQEAARRRYANDERDLAHELAVIDKEFERNTLSREEFIASRADLNLDSMSPEQQQYLKEIVGESLFARILDANVGGAALTDQELALASLQINNRTAGLTSLTSAQRLSGINNIIAPNLSTLGKEKGLSRAVADTYMSQWSGWNHYAALLEAQNLENTELFESLGGQEQLNALSQSLENFKKSAEIDLEIEGIQSLEDANKLLEGTTKLVRQLKEGGKAEIEAKLKITSDLFNQAQLDAMLNSGNAQLIDQAAQQITGISGAQYFANRDQYIGEAISLRQATRNLTAPSLMEDYKASTDKVRFLRGLQGTGWSLSNGEFIYNPEDYVFENPYAGKEKQYTDLELAQKRAQILDETLGETGEGYAAALSSGGARWAEYQRLKASGKASDDDLAKTLEEARKEEAIALQEATEQQALEDAKLNSNTVGGAFAYAQLRYQQNNKAGLAANAIYESLTNGNINSIADLATIVESQDVQNWNDLLESSNDVRKAFEDMGAINKDGQLDFSNVEMSAEGLSSALAVLVQAVAGASEAYNKQQEVLSVGETQERALAYIGGGDVDEDLGFAAYSEYTGNSNLAQLIRNNRLEGKAIYTDLNDFERTYAGLLEANAANGIRGLTEEQRYNGAMDIAAAAQNGTLDELRKGGRIGAFEDYLSGIQDVDQILADLASGDPEKAGKALENLNEQLNAKKAQDITRYSKGAANMADILTKIKKGGKDASEGMFMLNKNMKTYQDRATAISKSRGKTGAELDNQTREILAGMFESVSVEDIKKMTSDELASLLEGSQDAINEAFTDDIQAVFDDAVAAAGLDGITVDLSNIAVDTNGEISLEALAAACNETAAGILAQIASMSGEYGKVRFVVDENGNVVSVKGVVEKSGKGYHGGGGGGGGGKSPLDRLLEEQKRKVAEIEHQSKMVEIQQKHYDFVGDYESYNDTVVQEIDLQEQLRSTYTNNLAELQKMMKSVKEGSDDWKKLRDAVMQAEEALLSINNTIDELNGKYITSEQSKQDKTDKVQNHALTMLQKRAARYQTQGRFEAYETETLRTLDTIRSQIETNNSQIKSWESVLATMKEGDKNWEETRDKIWAIQEENAELENQLASDMISLQEARAAQIAHDLQNENVSYEHANNIFETYAGMAESIGDYESYRSFLTGTNTNNSIMRDQTAKAIVELKKQIESMGEDDPARENAISTLYQLEESVAKYEASILSNRQAIEESYVTEVTENASKAMRSMEHEFEMLEEAEKEFVRNDDFVNQENIMFEKARNVSDRIAEQREILEGYYEIQSSGKIAEGSKQWDALQDSIYATEKTIASLTSDYQGFVDKAQTLKFDNLVENFGDFDDQLTHNLKMIQYEETRYQNKNELTNYGSMLEMDTSIQKERAANIRKHIEDLKAQQYDARNYPELYDRITKEIYKWEEALSQTNNTIEKNEDLLKKNEEAIRKAKQAVENIVDKEIRTRIQKERDMLSATVSIENTIVDVIRKRYQSEWELEQKTLDKKKQALNEEKNLINERLNAKKKAMDQEDKYEELAEYRRQLTLISADPTRTKEATELRSKIKELQRELSWTVAEDEANALLEGIDDQIKAIDEYVSTYSEDLNEMLSDANNFKDDLSNIMGGSFEAFLAYMKENSEDYKKATDDTRKQMEQGWEDTWTTMLGELKSYWGNVDETMRTKEGFLAYMLNSDSYLSASKSGKESLLQTWEDVYDAYTSSIVDNASYEHSHEMLSKIDELKNWTFNVQLVNPEGYVFNPLYSSFMYRRSMEGAEAFDPYNLYAGVGLHPEPEPVPTPSGGSSGGTSTNDKTYSRRVYYTYGSGSISEVIGRGKTPEDALKNAYALVPKTAHHADTSKEALQKWINSSNPTIPSVAEATKGVWSQIYDNLSRALIPPVSSVAESIKVGASAVNIGDVNVNVSTSFDSDQDYDKLAERVGSAIMNAVEKQGIKLANYTI